MPTYDYVCEKCGQFQYMQKITEPALDKCPKCGTPVRRLISRNVNILLKGSGFYCTDNRKPEYVNKEKHENSKSNQAVSPSGPSPS